MATIPHYISAGLFELNVITLDTSYHWYTFSWNDLPITRHIQHPCLGTHIFIIKGTQASLPYYLTIDRDHH